MGKWLYKKIVLLFGCFTEIIFPKPSSCSGCGRAQKAFSRYKLCPACFDKLCMYKENGSKLYESEIPPTQDVIEKQTATATTTAHAYAAANATANTDTNESIYINTNVYACEYNHENNHEIKHEHEHEHEHAQMHIQAQTYAFDKEIVACCYEGIVREMIHKIKYKDKRDIAITIGAILADRIKQQKTAYDFIVPVPISRKKLSSRGYNHTSLIARELASLVNIKVLECLIRVKDTKPQVLFNVSDRWYNVKGCFKCIENIENKRILLVDDVITTGATAHFCAEALKASGASSVTIVAFAKSTSK
jgi:ComF family protein